MDANYDASWDLVYDEKNYNTPINEESFVKIFKEWQKRSWEPWLRESLIFPFIIKRMEDEDDAYFTDVAKHEPFRLGHVMKAVEIESEDDKYGIILKVREGRRTGYVPLFDVEVTDKNDRNFWPVREYVVWFANK